MLRRYVLVLRSACVAAYPDRAQRLWAAGTGHTSTAAHPYGTVEAVSHSEVLLTIRPNLRQVRGADLAASTLAAAFATRAAWAS